jgi:uncharacterized protein (DUF362 family)
VGAAHATAANLVALAERARPQISVVDAFQGSHRGGPQLGSACPLGTVVAGTDPVAVDAVAAAVMGFDPSQIDHLVRAQAAGLGMADLDAITVLGDPIEQVRGRLASHSKKAIQRSADPRLNPAHRPHFVAPQDGREG